MRTLITNGTIVTADGSYVADVLIDGETIAQIGRGPGRARGVTADETIDATGKYVIPGAIDVHTHMELPFGGTFAKDTFETGHARGGLRRDDHDRRLRRPGARASRCATGLDAWHAKAEGNAVADYGFHMIMSDVNDDDPGRDGHAGRRGRPRLQAVHRLSGRLLQRRRGDLPGDAADREERRADHDARRERDGDRRRRGPDRGRGQDRSVLPRRSPASRSSRARRPTGSSAWPRPPACPSTSSTCRRARRSTRSGQPATAAARVFAETCPQYLFLSLDDLGNGFEGAKFVCSPPLRPKDHWDELWTRPGQGRPAGGLDRPLPVRLPRPEGARPGRLPQGPERPARRRGPRRPAPRRRRRRRAGSRGSAGSRSSRPPRPSCSGCTRARARSPSASDADLVIYDPDREAHDLRGDPPHGRRLLVLRGPRGPGRARDVVLSRGSVIVRDGEFTGRKGHGQFIKRGRPSIARLT